MAVLNTHTAVILCALLASWVVYGQTYDYVIAGAGSSGLLLAVALSANPNVTVAVLEAGGDGRTDPRITVPENHGDIVGTIYDWNMTTTAQPGLPGGESIPVARGKVLGGTSAMNWMLWMRASAVEFDAYQSQLGNANWNWSTLDTDFKASEHFYNPPASQDNIYTYNDSDHGFSGPILGTMPKSVWSLYPDYVVPALKGLGVVDVQDRDGGITNGVGYVPLAIDPISYTRSYSASAYTAVQNRTNLHVYTNSTVSRVLWSATPSNGLAVANALEYYNSAGAKMHMNATNQVILSGGAFKTPQMLELSGVGNSTILHGLGIPTVVNLPAVGVGLTDHPTLAGQFSFNISNFTGGTYAQDFQDYPPASRFLSAGDLATLNSWLSSTTAPPGISQASYTMLKHLVSTNQPMIEFGYFLDFCTSYLLHPLSTGTVHINSTNAFAQPVINPGYNTAQINGTGVDLWLVAKAAQYLATVVPAAQPLAGIDAKFSINGSLPFSQFEQQIFPSLASGAHFTGSARMLPQGTGEGVVDNNLLVYGTKNVRIVDLSIVPAPPGQHPMGLAYAIAMRAFRILSGQI